LKLYKDIKVEIKDSDVLHRLGYSKGSAPSERMNRLVSDAVTHAQELIQPKALYEIWSAKLTKQGGVVLNNGAILSNPHAIKDWQGLEQVVIAVCTIGLALERQVKQLGDKGNVSSALILDTIGTLSVSSATRQIDAMVCQQANQQGMIAGPRFGPGSVDWDIKDQKILFDLLPTKKIGVKLTDHLLMIPLKSISFVVGMGAKVPKPRTRRPCWYCKRVSCPGRDVSTN
jgi:hypothetical protein